MPAHAPRAPAQSSEQSVARTEAFAPSPPSPDSSSNRLPARHEPTPSRPSDDPTPLAAQLARCVAQRAANVSATDGRAPPVIRGGRPAGPARLLRLRWPGEKKNFSSMQIAGAVEAWIKKLEDRVDLASRLITSLAFMRVGSRAGYMGKFEELALARLAGTLPPAEWNTAARKAGYWIEEFATNVTMPAHHHPAPGELGWAYQIAAGKTRPDIELYWNAGGGPQRIGWVDITSSAQKGHILKKSSTLWTSGHLQYVGEVLYTSIDFLGLGSTIDALNGDLSKVPPATGDLTAAVAAYDRIKDERRAEVLELSAALFDLGKAVKADPLIVRSKEQAAMRWAMYYLLEPTGSRDEWKPKTAASVLLAAQIPPLNYGWGTRTGATAQAGWRWLTEHGITKPPAVDEQDIANAVHTAKMHLALVADDTDDETEPAVDAMNVG